MNYYFQARHDFSQN